MQSTELSPFEYFKTCITARYADFDGRARRAEYWYFQLFLMLSYIPFIILAIIGVALEVPALAVIGILLGSLLVIGLILPSLAVTVRRLHDTNKSGWFYLIAFVPFGSLVLFVFTVLEGDRHPNLYGPDPKAPFEADIVDHLESV